MIGNPVAGRSGKAIIMTTGRILPPPSGEPCLLTPGPLTTAHSVKEAMLRDWGSWDGDFRAMTARLRRELLQIAEDDGSLDCVPMQGSGTFCVEAMLGSLIPHDGRTLVLSNGAYGQRMAAILARMGRAHVVLDKGDYLPPRGAQVAQILARDTTITDVAVVHCETSSGILNPLHEISDAARAAGRRLWIDSMSAFGALPLTPAEITFEGFVSSANKCIEGVPGFGFVIARKEALARARGNAHSLSLDLHDQWDYMNRTGQWRFTPPTHVVAAFLRALKLHREEGGVKARAARYAHNRDVLVAGMRALGFETLLSEAWLSPIIVTFFAPAHPAFDFQHFYDLMKQQGFIIYPGKLTRANSFRIGCIGQVDAHVMRQVTRAAAEALAAMGVPSGAPSPEALQERKRLSDCERSEEQISTH